MTKIYVIEQGSYSDYRVVGIYSTRENAELIIASMENRFDIPTIAEWEMDKNVDLARQGYKPYYIRMLRDGEVVVCNRGSNLDMDPFYSVMLYDKANGFGPLSEQTLCLWAYIIAKSDEHAVKIVNEKRLQLLAENNWKVQYNNPIVGVAMAPEPNRDEQ